MTSNDRNRALVTGVTGQDGSYLAELLLSKGYEVWGVVRRNSSSHKARLDSIYSDPSLPHDRFHLVYGDLSDATSLMRIVNQIRPDEIYNLGAQSHVKVSFDIPEYTGDVTGLGPMRLLEAARQLQLDAKFYQASSSELFGKALEAPQTESTPFYPRSPYACAKAFAYYVTRNYREAYGLYAVNGILFNHESPRRGPSFVTRKISRAAAAIAKGRQDRLRLGNLDARRDWGFAGDYVEAIWRMMQADEADDFVIATGQTHSVRQFCDIAFSHVDLPLVWEGEGVDQRGVGPDGRVLVQVDPEYFRPTEVDLMLGDASKAHATLGWRPQVGFQDLVRMMVDADLNSVAEPPE